MLFGVFMPKTFRLQMPSPDVVDRCGDVVDVDVDWTIGQRRLKKHGDKLCIDGYRHKSA